MCNCDCELPKEERWGQIRRAMAEKLIEEIKWMEELHSSFDIKRVLGAVRGKLEREANL